MKKIIFICVSLIVVIVSWFIYFRHLPNKDNSTISDAQLQSNINAIARKHTNMFAKCEIDEKYDKYISNSNQRVIGIGGAQSIYINTEPDEIYGIFECWMFLKDKKLPYDVVAIYWNYNKGGLDNTNEQETTITKSEFKDLHNRVDISDLDREKAANTLADAWIAETGYIKE